MKPSPKCVQRVLTLAWRGHGLGVLPATWSGDALEVESRCWVRRAQ